MSLKKKFSQYGTLIVGLMIGGGFAFGGIASYAGLTDSGGSNNQQQQFDATLPNSTYTETGYGLTLQEQMVLAAQNDVVFVNALYGDEEGKAQLESLSQLESDFNGRIYISNVNYNQSAFTSYGFTDLPQAVVVGGTPVSQTRTATVMVDNVTQSSVASASCGVMRNWNDLGAYCQAR